MTASLTPRGKTRTSSGALRGALILAVLIVSATQAAAQSINLQWDPTQGTIAGYRVYVGTTSGSYSQSFDVGNHTTYSFLNPQPGVRYYFAVTSYDANGQESPYSNEVSAVFGGDTTPPTIAISESPLRMFSQAR